jgi:Ca2+-binding EF-hand superfamily protein
MKNIGADLSHEQLGSLFSEIDIDKSGLIDIDELIYFVTKDNENVRGLAASAVLNVIKTV